MLPGKTYNPEDVVRIIKNRIWVLLVPFAIISAATALIVHQLPDRYRSETVILVVPQRVPEEYVRSTVTTRIEDRLQSLVQQILSRSRLERIIQDFNLYADERRTGIMEDIVEAMRRDIGVNILPGEAFRISYTGANPRTVTRVTERLASLFIEENFRDREVLAEGTNQFLEAQLEDARRRLIEQEKKVEAYRKQFAGQLPSQLESNLQVLQNSQVQVQSILESINRDRDRRLVLERQIADLEQQGQAALVVAPPAPADASATATPTQRLAAAKASLATAQLRLKPDHPDIQRLNRLIRDLENKVEQDAQDTPVSAEVNDLSPGETARRRRVAELKLEMQLLDRQIEEKQNDQQRLRAQIGSYQSRVEAAPTRESEMTELTRDYQTLQAMYTSLLSKKEESTIAANLERRQIGEQFKLLDPARVAEKPYSPNRPRLTLIGMAAGLAIGVLLVALLEYRDKSFKTDGEIMRVLSLPVLAVVPVMLTQSEQRWATRRRLLLGLGYGTTVLACFAVIAYTFVY
jgi:polysaccharide chain length determinant protein (PEP-CTERM system associated)